MNRYNVTDHWLTSNIRSGNDLGEVERNLILRWRSKLRRWLNTYVEIGKTRGICADDQLSKHTSLLTTNSCSNKIHKDHYEWYKVTRFVSLVFCNGGSQAWRQINTSYASSSVVRPMLRRRQCLFWCIASHCNFMLGAYLCVRLYATNVKTKCSITGHKGRKRGEDTDLVFYRTLQKTKS